MISADRRFGVFEKSGLEESLARFSSSRLRVGFWEVFRGCLIPALFYTCSTGEPTAILAEDMAAPPITVPPVWVECPKSG